MAKSWWTYLTWWQCVVSPWVVFTCCVTSVWCNTTDRIAMSLFSQCVTASCWWVRHRCHSSVAHKLYYIGIEWDMTGTFSGAKMYWNMMWKSPRFVPFVVNLTHYGPACGTRVKWCGDELPLVPLWQRCRATRSLPLTPTPSTPGRVNLTYKLGQIGPKWDKSGTF